MKHPLRVRAVQRACLLAVLAAAPAAQAFPTSVEDALRDLFGALVWSALGLPQLPGDLVDSRPLLAQAGEPAAMLLTLAGPGDDRGGLQVLSESGGRWVLSEAAALPTSARSDVRWGVPLWLGTRRVLVVEGERHGPFGDDRAVCDDCEAWRRFYVVGRDGRLRAAGELDSADPYAVQRSNGVCVWLGAGVLVCWDPQTQSLR